MDWRSQSRQELHAETVELRKEVKRLTSRAVEDRHRGEKRVELAIRQVKGLGPVNLERQFGKLQKTIAEDDLLIDRMVVFLTGNLRI